MYESTVCTHTFNTISREEYVWGRLEIGMCSSFRSDKRREVLSGWPHPYELANRIACLPHTYESKRYLIPSL